MTSEPDLLRDDCVQKRSGIDPGCGTGSLEHETSTRRRPGGSSGHATTGRSAPSGASRKVRRTGTAQRPGSTGRSSRRNQALKISPGLTILDAYAVLAFLKDEAAASEVEALITAGSSALTVVGLAEVLDNLIRIGGSDDEDASLDVGQLRLNDPVPIDEKLAGAAGRLRARHYHRVQRPVSLADCLAGEVARSQIRPLATSDPALLDVCHDEGIAVIVLAGSDGSRWTPSP